MQSQKKGLCNFQFAIAVSVVDADSGLVVTLVVSSDTIKIEKGEQLRKSVNQILSRICTRSKICVDVITRFALSLGQFELVTLKF